MNQVTPTCTACSLASKHQHKSKDNYIQRPLTSHERVGGKTRLLGQRQLFSPEEVGEVACSEDVVAALGSRQEH